MVTSLEAHRDCYCPSCFADTGWWSTRLPYSPHLFSFYPCPVLTAIGPPADWGHPKRFCGPQASESLSLQVIGSSGAASHLPGFVSTAVPSPELGIQVAYNGCLQNEGGIWVALSQGRFCLCCPGDRLSQPGGQVQIYGHHGHVQLSRLFTAQGSSTPGDKWGIKHSTYILSKSHGHLHWLCLPKEVHSSFFFLNKHFILE